MKSISILTAPYGEKSPYIRKKAEYSAVFMILILCVMLLILGSELFSFGFSRVKIVTTLGFVSGFGLLFLLLRKGRLEWSLNLLILSGFLRCLMIMEYYLTIQFYSTAFLVILSIGVVHIRRYQLYLSYAVFWNLLLVRLLLYREVPSYFSPEEAPLHQALYSLFLFTLFIVMTHFIVRVIEREIREGAKLERLAETDALTGAGNRRKFHRTVAALGPRGKNAADYSLLLMDLDHFKKINDKYGHDTGDLVLRETVQLVAGVIREEDSLYRWGGEEFLLLIPTLTPVDLPAAAERIRKAVENHTFPEQLRITVSIGAAAGEDSRELSQLIRQADEALYRAKQAGRNRVSL